MAKIADSVKKAQKKLEASAKKKTAVNQKVNAKNKSASQAVKDAVAKAKKKASEKSKSSGASTVTKPKADAGNSTMTSTERARHGLTNKGVTGMTSTERARHANAEAEKEWAPYFDYERKTKDYAKKVDASSGMTATEKARHKASYDTAQFFKEYDKAKKAADEYREYQDQQRRNSYRNRRKKDHQERTSSPEYAQRRNPAHVRGMNYNDDLHYGENYYTKQVSMGAESVPADIAKAIQSAREAQKGQMFLGGRAPVTNPELQKNIQESRDEYTDSERNVLTRYAKNYDERLARLNSDYRAGSLGSQLAFGAGRLGADLAFAALDPTPVGELRLLARAPKAAKGLANFLKTPVNKPGRLLESSTAYYGNRYDEAIKAGATPEEAHMAAAIYAFPQAYTEGLGGAEGVISRVMRPGTNIGKAAIRSGVSEAVEEAAQTPWESGTRRLYGADIPLFSRDQEAIVNPGNMAESALVGGILGAAGGVPASVRAQMDVNSYRNYIRSEAENAIDVVIDRMAKGVISEEAGRYEIDIIRRQAAEEEAEIERAVGNTRRARRAEQRAGIDPVADLEYNDTINNQEALTYADYPRPEVATDDQAGTGRLDDGTLRGSIQQPGRPAGLRESPEIGYDAEGDNRQLYAPLSNQAREVLEQRGLYRAGYEATEDKPLFSDALNAAIQSHEKGAMVDARTPEDLSRMKTFLSGNQLSGVAVEDNGNITAVFNNANNPNRGIVPEMFAVARNNGAVCLDCFASFAPNGEYQARNLVDTYTKNGGFVPVAWMEFDPSFDVPAGNPYAPPDVVFMAVNEDTVEEFAEKSGSYKTWTVEEVHALPKFTYYEAAQQYAAEIGRRNMEAGRSRQQAADEGQRFSNWQGTANWGGDGNVDGWSYELPDTASGHARTAFDVAMQNGDIDAAQEIANAVKRGDQGVTREAPYTDVQAQRDAAETISQSEDFNGAVRDFIDRLNPNEGFVKKASGRSIGKDTVTEGISLYVEACNRKDSANMAILLQANADLAREIGRALQAFTQLRKLTPEGRVYHDAMMLRKEVVKSEGFDPNQVRQDVEGKVKASIPSAVQGFIESSTGSADTSSESPKDRARVAADVRRTQRRLRDENIGRQRRGEEGEGDVIARRIGDAKKRRKQDRRDTSDLPLSEPTIKSLMEEGMVEMDAEIKEIIDRYDLDGLSAKLANYVVQNSGTELSVDEFGRVLDFISNGIERSVNDVRVKTLKDEIKKTGRATKEAKNKSRFLENMVIWSNAGLLNDPDKARATYNAYGLPYLDDMDIESMTELYRIAESVRKGEIDTIEDDDLNYIDEDGNEHYVLEDHLSYSDVKLLNKRLGSGNQEDVEYVAKALEGKAKKVGEDKLVGNNWQKLRQWQITSMLLNIKTTMRNFLPNLVMLPLNQAGRVGGAIADKIAARQTGVRTMGAPSGPIQTARDMARGAKNAADDLILGVDTSDTKTELSMRHAFKDRGLGRGINTATDIMSFLLKVTDMPFEQVYYNQSLEKQMDLNKVDEPTELMKEIAYVEAMRRTFKDDNAFTQFAQSLVDILNTIGGGPGTFGLGSILVPFVRTPANLTKLVYEYAPPVALVKAVVDGRRFVNAPDGDEKILAQNNFVNSVSHLVSGTLLTSIIFALRDLGLFEIVGGWDDDDWKENNYQRDVHGKQEYAIRIGDYWFNYGNLQPIGSLVALSSDSYDVMFGGKDVDAKFLSMMVGTLFNSLAASTEMLYEQSVFKGISDLFSGRDGIVDGVANLIGQLPQQMIPALIQQLGRFGDPWQRDTALAIDDGFARTVAEGAFTGTLRSLPFLNTLLPQKTDAYGLPMERYDGGTAWDFFNAFINPVTTTKEKAGNFSGVYFDDDFTEEEAAAAIEFIEDIGVKPQGATRLTEIGGEKVRMGGKERSDYNRNVGSVFLKEIVLALRDKDFTSLGRDDKKYIASKVLEDVKKMYELTRELETGSKSEDDIRYEINRKLNYDPDFRAINASSNYDLSLAEYYVVERKINEFEGTDDDGDGASQQARKWLLDKSNLTDEQKLFFAEGNTTILSKDQKSKMYTAVDAAGISKIDYLFAFTYNAVGHIEGDDGQRYMIEALKLLPDAGVEAWYNGTKYTGGAPVKDKYDIDEFISAYKAFLDVNNGARRYADKSAAVNRLNISASMKRDILAANNSNPDSDKCVALTDGGDVEVADAKSLRASTKKNTKTFTEKLEDFRRKINQVDGMTRSERERRIGAMEVTEYYKEPQLTKPVGMEGYYRTGEFGENRGDHNHAGVDIGVNGKDNISANSVVSGKVVRVVTGSNGGYGNMVIIQGDDGWSQVYAHLDSIADGLKVGKTVKAGQQIGVVGNTGRSTGIHLHFEVRRDPFDSKSAVDPESVYDIFGNGVKEAMSEASSDPNYRPSSKSKKTSSSGSSSGGGSKKSGSSKPTPKSGVSGHGSYNYSGDTFDYSGYTGAYTYGGYDFGNYYKYGQ